MTQEKFKPRQPRQLPEADESGSIAMTIVLVMILMAGILVIKAIENKDFLHKIHNRPVCVSDVNP